MTNNTNKPTINTKEKMRNTFCILVLVVELGAHTSTDFSLVNLTHTAVTYKHNACDS